jgi:hypothetical protein
VMLLQADRQEGIGKTSLGVMTDLPVL